MGIEGLFNALHRLVISNTFVFCWLYRLYNALHSFGMDCELNLILITILLHAASRLIKKKYIIISTYHEKFIKYVQCIFVFQSMKVNGSVFLETDRYENNPLSAIRVQIK